MRLISIKEYPEWKEKTIHYIQRKWANDQSMMVYEDCITNCISSESPLPHLNTLVLAIIHGERALVCREKM